MSRAPFRLAPLDAAHERAAFDSESEPLNRNPSTAICASTLLKTFAVA